MVHRPDDAAGRVEADVQQDHRERDLLAHDAEQHEHVGDHHRGEELQEVLHPQVHDPEAPELRDREVIAGAGDQPDRVERRDRQRGEEEQPRHVGRVLAAQPRAQDAPEHEDPDEQAGGQQHLVDPGEVEVLEALQPEPVRHGALEHAVDPEERPDQRAEDDDRERAEQRERELALVARLAAGDHRRQEDPGGDERRRDPEQRELHVPGAHQVVREDLREVEAEEARQLRPVVLGGGADERLDHEQRGHHEEEPRARALRRRQGHVAGCAERQRGLLAPVPAEPPAPAPERREQQRRSPRAARSARGRSRRPRSPSGWFSTRGSGGQLFV